MSLNKNERHPQEYRLVTDGKQLYRLAPHFEIPDGIHEVFTHFGKSVYSSKGKLLNQFQALQRIQPSMHLSKVTMNVRHAIKTKYQNES